MKLEKRSEGMLCYHMPSKKPRITLKQLAIYLSEWWLLSEGSDKWLDDPRVMAAWNVSLFSLLAGMIAIVSARVFFENLLEQSSRAALLFRCTEISIAAWLLVAEVIVAVAYYRNLLLTGLDLRFKSIFSLWANWVAIFTVLYLAIFSVAPNAFHYPKPIVGYSPVVVQIGLITRYNEVAHFAIYSAATALGTTVPYMTSASIALSAINLVEAAGSFLLGAVFVATLVNKASTEKDR